MLYQLFKYIFLITGKILFRAEAHGVENIPQNEGVLFISNHASYIDPPAVGMFVPWKIHFLAKYELFRVPVLGWIIKRLNTVPVKRGGVDRKAIRNVRRLLREGKQVLVFPEGTRSKTGDLGPIRQGVMLMLEGLTDISIVPVYIDGSYRALPKGKIVPRPKKIRLFYGKPFKLPQKGVEIQKREHYKKTSELLFESIKTLKNEKME